MKRLIGYALLLLILTITTACGGDDDDYMTHAPEAVFDAPIFEIEYIQIPINPIIPPQSPPTAPARRPLPETIANTGVLPSGVAFADIERLIDEFFAENEQSMAAFSVAIFVGDYIILENSYGFVPSALPQLNIRNNHDIMFSWGHITKTLVWVSAMQLYERGLLDLDADIRQFLPDGFISMLEGSGPITMLHLMSHSSGLACDPAISFGFAASAHHPINQSRWHHAADDFDFGRFVQDLGLDQVWAHAGNRFVYSNYNAVLAAYIIEQITNMPFYQYVGANIFEPLGMAHTALAPGHTDNASVMAQWERQRHTRFIIHPCMNVFRSRPSEASRQYVASVYPSGNAVGTLADLLTYAQAFLPDANGGSPLFQNPETLARMLSISHMPSENSPARIRVRHGLFDESMIGLVDRQTPVIGHISRAPHGIALMAIDIESGVGMVFATNVADEVLFYYEMLRLVFGALLQDYEINIWEMRDHF